MKQPSYQQTQFTERQTRIRGLKEKRMTARIKECISCDKCSDIAEHINKCLQTIYQENNL